jgi:hypothetical protein
MMETLMNEEYEQPERKGDEELPPLEPNPLIITSMNEIITRKNVKPKLVRWIFLVQEFKLHACNN